MRFWNQLESGTPPSAFTFHASGRGETPNASSSGRRNSASKSSGAPPASRASGLGIERRSSTSQTGEEF
jgi:hypothetical protein